jgi:hypothetical protein
LNPIQGEEQRNAISLQVDTSNHESGCTREPKTEQTNPLAALGAALIGLSPEDWAQLVATLFGTGRPEGA